MKYIRTKDSVYELKYDKEDKNYYYKFSDYCFVEIDNIKEHKVSGNLQDLCDMFVVLKPDKKFLLANNNFDYIKTIWRGNENAEKSDYIYGAIWTDKGLIYVAKMNDEGELELL